MYRTPDMMPEMYPEVQTYKEHYSEPLYLRKISNMLYFTATNTRRMGRTWKKRERRRGEKEKGARGKTKETGELWLGKHLVPISSITQCRK